MTLSRDPVTNAVNALAEAVEYARGYGDNNAGMWYTAMQELVQWQAENRENDAAGQEELSP